MGRWEANARGRLEEAALSLYTERGFEQTTVAEIARAAGLTERTFFRHYADKREVLFWGAGALQESVVDAVASAPVEATPMAVVALVLDTVATAIPAERREQSRQRQAVIAVNPGLRERELIKLATLSGALAGAFRGRGMSDLAASLLAETTVSVFKIGFELWVAPGNEATLGLLMRDSLAELRTVTGG